MKMEKSKIAILGPEYSYCHILAKKVFPESTFVLCQNIEEIFKTLSEKKVEIAIAPIENMLHGSVRESVIALKKYLVKINASYDLPIHHCLASKTNKFTKIISHPQALAQCSSFLNEYRDNKYLIEESASTSKAMEIASKDKEYAAIGSEEAASKYKLKILNKQIEDNHNNTTRFILISNKESIPDKENSRTSILVAPGQDKPGLLFEILSIFKANGINLTKIESIPTGKKLGEYLFFMEIDGSLEQENVFSAIDFLKDKYELFSFGSYNLEKVN